MRFLCDVHISYKLVNHLITLGYECIHVNNILDKLDTADKDICSYADKEDFAVITKDSDFRDSFWVNNTPKKLIKINLGNIKNSELAQIIELNIDAISKLNNNHNFLVEIDKTGLSYILK